MSPCIHIRDEMSWHPPIPPIDNPLGVSRAKLADKPKSKKCARKNISFGNSLRASENLESLIKACFKSESTQILVKLKRVLFVFALLQRNIKHLQVSECKANQCKANQCKANQCKANSQNGVGQILFVKLLNARKTEEREAIRGNLFDIHQVLPQCSSVYCPPACHARDVPAFSQ